jgi:ubiquinone/menaquinone biosynthesis C-methylase UbiE
MSSGPEMSSEIRKYWDAAAETYASLDLFNSTQTQCEAWSFLLARIFPPEQPLDIIDIGCGSGFVSLSLAALGHRVTGLDISSEMLRMCRARADARGLTNLTLALGEAENPPSGLGPADAVVSRHVLWTLPQPESAVAAWVDLTKPGGRVLGIDSLWSPELISDMNGQDYPVEVTRSLPLLHARDLDPVRNVWRRAGLENVMVEYLAWIDEALRAEASPEMAMMCRDLRFYLIEGTRPAPAAVAELLRPDPVR